MFEKKGFNMEFPGGIKIKDVATKIGGILRGEEGSELGRQIDEVTKNITIKFEPNSDDKDNFKIW
ncbi:hypothetical protein PN398_09535 [Romboutsia sp. 1001216sp1]|uniref:hypothetical protein n=1 Tax=unclassified Romboutsia TaxID=2626894 RepID=UPI00189F1850|nr:MULTISPECIES: hypothetical protein [unclassified Romboutsia]MDB8790968.1 hypothetical protein [Romboutsia sp. 1001216sp1]MDB8802413.1 hypothetical protein [Romboutsia sp. 1001216sp1]MDB8813810.1 hypothetical protein [Romboutsia sp. 1001216sp1]